MRTKVFLPLLFVSACVVTQPLNAQLVDLTDERTAEQKWIRSVNLIDFMWIAIIGHGKSLGQTPEQVGKFIGEFAAPSWGATGSRTLASFVRGMYRNYNLYADLEFEVLSETEAEVHVRMNIPYVSSFGENGERNGVTLEELQQVIFLGYEGIADHLGFDMTHEINGDWIECTVKTRS
jgi:hypothetical protein